MPHLCCCVRAMLYLNYYTNEVKITLRNRRTNLHACYDSVKFVIKSDMVYVIDMVEISEIDPPSFEIKSSSRK